MITGESTRMHQLNYYTHDIVGGGDTGGVSYSGGAFEICEIEIGIETTSEMVRYIGPI